MTGHRDADRLGVLADLAFPPPRQVLAHQSLRARVGLLEELAREGLGDILIFMNGEREIRDAAVLRYVAKAAPADKPQMAEQLKLTAQRALGLFAGAERASQAKDAAAPGGLQALAQFVEASVPEAERARVSEVLLRIVNGCLFELANLGREQAGLKPLVSNESTDRFMTQSVLSLSDAMFYPAPVLLQLADFKQIQASVFQVTRAPGRNLVYLGAVLLIIGVFTMLYIRERRLWVWLQADGDGQGTRLQAALSTTRRTLDTDAEFERLTQDLLPPTAKDAP